jgi:hypothetical protein
MTLVSWRYVIHSLLAERCGVWVVDDGVDEDEAET